MFFKAANSVLWNGEVKIFINHGKLSDSVFKKAIVAIEDLHRLSEPNICNKWKFSMILTVVDCKIFHLSRY